MLRCPKCKAKGMKVQCRPAVITLFDGDYTVEDHEFEEGPGAHESNDPAFCRDDCGFVGEPEDFEVEEEEKEYFISYEHTDCPVEPGITWADVYSCAANGECPVCHTKDIVPVSYRILENEDAYPGLTQLIAASQEQED